MQIFKCNRDGMLQKENSEGVKKYNPGRSLGARTIRGYNSEGVEI
jgi:hypothetical protein